MSDNIVVKNDATTTVATVAADEVTDGTLGVVKVQYIKIMDGALDGTTKAGVGSAGLKVDASGAAVPITDNSGSLTVDNGGTFAVQESGGALTALQLIDNPVGSLTGGSAGTSSYAVGGQYNSSAPTLTNAQQAAMQLDSSGNLKVNVAAGSSAVSTTSSVNHLVATGTSGDATNIKASAGTVYGVRAFNNGSGPALLKLYNSGSVPSAGSGTPKTVVAIQAGVAVNVVFPQGGLAFSSGIGFTLVTGLADNSSTGVTASSVVVDIDWA